MYEPGGSTNMSASLKISSATGGITSTETTDTGTTGKPATGGITSTETTDTGTTGEPATGGITSTETTDTGTTGKPATGGITSTETTDTGTTGEPATGGITSTETTDTGTTGEPATEPDAETLWMRKYFAKAMGIWWEPEPEHLLEEISFDGIARYIASDRCNKIVVMTGAGISTSAGIPDFRSPGTGCYDHIKKEYNIENPQQLFDISFFKENPEPYYKYRKELWRGNFKPTPCHYFIRLLQEKKKLLRHFTQNIDGLELVAGIKEELLIQAHGTMQRGHCFTCNKQYTQSWITEKIYSPDGPVPRCTEADCGGVVRPDIVMFGENLPARFAEHLSDIDECDFLLIMGTSLAVKPFAKLPIRTKDNVPRLFINLEKVQTATHPISVLFFGGGFDFDKDDNIRDVFWQGTCDDGCYALADLMGFGDDLRALVKEEHTRLSTEWGITDDTAASNKPSIALQTPVANEPQETVTTAQQNPVTIEIQSPNNRQPQEPLSGQPPKSAFQQPPNSDSNQPPKSATKQPPKSASNHPPKSATKQPPKSATKQPPKSAIKQPPKSATKQPLKSASKH